MIIQIAGNNGTGKTTIIRQLMAQSTGMTVISACNRNKAAMILPDIGWAIVGYYPPTAQSGGCDNLSDMQEIKDVLMHLLDTYPDYNVVLEGVMISLSMTMYNFIMQQALMRNTRAHIVVLTSDLQRCHDRIMKRTGKPLAKWDLFITKHNQMERNLRKYASGTFTRVDVDNIAESDMLDNFICAIGATKVNSSTMSKIVQVKGSNGSGKTTLARQLLALSNDKYYALHPDTRKPYATILYDLQWILIGVYDEDKKMGGADGIHTMSELHDILVEMVETYPNYWIFVEGMMISTTMTVYHYMLELEKSHSIVPMVVVLKSSVEGCLKRLEHRRGSPLERTDLVAEKCELVLKHQYKPEHVAYIDVDNIAEQDMVRRFLETVGDDLVYSYL